MLGSRHASKEPLGLKRLVLASAPADMGLWVERQNALRTELPQDVQDVLNKHKRDGSTDSAEYKAAVEVFYSRFLCRIHPLPDPLAEGFGWIEKDPTCYENAWLSTDPIARNGPSEFDITGPLRNWSIISDAHKLNVPTLSLLLNGRYDEARDSVVAPFFREIPPRQVDNFR
ncbi:hypothetical protein K438DRAFT_2136591 [Mycena galopus ATCC 62051]|nr:hypothetical protein K438DRAFT_2136591 [Mycena galopus ATCC 62051]